MHLGVTMRSVAPGVAAIPVTTAGGNPKQRGRAEVVGESTYTASITEIKPARAAVHGIYSIEDSLRLPGLADAIQRDMTSAMTERIDRIIFVGDSGADETGANVVGLNTVTIGESTITQTLKCQRFFDAQAVLRHDRRAVRQCRADSATLLPLWALTGCGWQRRRIATETRL